MVSIAGLDLREVEDVVDEGQERLAGLLDHVEVLSLLGAELGLEHELRHADDAVQRRANLVAHVGQELALHTVGRVGRILRALPLCNLPAEAEDHSDPRAERQPEQHGCAGRREECPSFGLPNAAVGSRPRVGQHRGHAVHVDGLLLFVGGRKEHCARLLDAVLSYERKHAVLHRHQLGVGLIGLRGPWHGRVTGQAHHRLFERGVQLGFELAVSRLPANVPRCRRHAGGRGQHLIEVQDDSTQFSDAQIAHPLRVSAAIGPVRSPDYPAEGCECQRQRQGAERGWKPRT